MVDPRIKQVEALFAKQQADGKFPGGQLVVMHDDEVVCDVSLGLARGYREGEERVPVTRETRFQVMSASKPFVAFAIALLDDAGRIDLGAPVARYFPEFAQHGKERITIDDVLSHRSGVALEELNDHVEWWSNWDTVVNKIADAKPTYPRGTLAYSPAGFGWILAEVVQRITQESLQNFLIGRLPPPLSGIRFIDPTQRETVARSYWLGAKRFMLAGHDLASDFERINNEITSLTAKVPGAGMFANARELASFYSLLAAGGRGLISTATLAKYVKKQSFGFERELKIPLALGRGFGVGSLGPHAFGWWNTQRCFGHAGGFGVVAYGDPKSRLGVAIVTNGHRGLGDLVRRFAPLGSAIRKAIPEP